MKQALEMQSLFVRRKEIFAFWTMAIFLGSIIFVSKLYAAPKPAQPEISVSFDRQSFIAGEPFQLEISVAAQGQGEPKISLPSFEGMKVLRKNVSRPSSGYSFSMSFGTGKNSQRVIKSAGTTRYDIVMVAQKLGKYNIGPVKVVLDGYTFTGKTYPIEVFERGTASAAPTDAAAATKGGLTEEQLEGARLESDYFLHMIPSKRTCSVGEMVVLDVYLFTSVSNIRADQFEKEPGTEGFWVERFEDFDLRNHRNQQVVVNGVLYEQAILKKLALFPLKSGKLTIAPPVFSFVVGGGGFMGFSRGKMVKRAASPVSIDVQPLPSDGRPSQFVDTNVGRYNLFVDTNEKSLKVGEPITVTVSVRGQGNIRNVELPVFQEVDDFKMYAPETDVEVQARGGSVSGMSQSRTLFIPEAEGKLTIPSLSWSYFDLVSKSYKTLKSDAMTINVAAGKPATQMAPLQSGSNAQGGEASFQKGPITRMNAKMRTIVDGVDTSTKHDYLFVQGWYLGLVFGTPALYLLFLLAMHARKRSVLNSQKGRSKRAEATAQKALHQLQKESDSSESSSLGSMSNDQFFSKLHKIVLMFLEHRLAQNVVGDTMGQLAARLGNRGIHENQVQKIIAALEEYEFARFAKSGSEKGQRQSEVARASEIISKIAKVVLEPLPTTKKEGIQ